MARRTEVHGARIVEQYPRQYATEQSIVAHLRFALRHEPIDLGVLVATFRAIEAADLEAWVRAKPTGAFSRRACFFYETFTGRMLDLDDARTGNYVPALDPGKLINYVPALDPGTPQVAPPPRGRQPARWCGPVPDGQAHAPA